MKILITGVLGFIGSYLAKYVINDPHLSIVGVSRNTDQKNHRRLEILTHNVVKDRFRLVFADLARDDISEIMDDVDYVVHCAAKSFVDHSIKDPEPFVQSNIVGTFKLLEEARKARSLKLFLHVSTDEVYGQILEGAYKEDAPLNPRNPYASTKAASDLLCLSYHNTYGLPIVITRTENNFGPYQNPQKAIPKFVANVLKGQKIPVYGDGKHRRMWLHVEDHCRAIMHLIKNGKVGEIYHVAGEQELENLELAHLILKFLGKMEPEDKNWIQLVPDFDVRPGHDRRYALNVEKLKATGWVPKIPLMEGLKQTVDWYVSNSWWLD